jgi:rod shape-determining protein MreD
MMRTLLRAALITVAASLALALELSAVPSLHLPYAVPDLMLLVVFAFAAGWGTVGGASAGFAIGLAQDLAPPALSAVGRHALVLTLVGALAGRAAREVRRSALRTSLLAGLYAVGATLLNVLIGLAIGDGVGHSQRGLLLALGATALYTAVATPLVVPGLAALARKVAGPRARFLAPVGHAVDGPARTSPAYTSPGLYPEAHPEAERV